MSSRALEDTIPSDLEERFYRLKNMGQTKPSNHAGQAAVPESPLPGSPGTRGHGRDRVSGASKKDAEDFSYVTSTARSQDQGCRTTCPFQSILDPGSRTCPRTITPSGKPRAVTIEDLGAEVDRSIKKF